MNISEQNYRMSNLLLIVHMIWTRYYKKDMLIILTLTSYSIWNFLRNPNSMNIRTDDANISWSSNEKSSKVKLVKWNLLHVGITADCRKNDMKIRRSLKGAHHFYFLETLKARNLQGVSEEYFCYFTEEKMKKMKNSRKFLVFRKFLTNH